MDAKEKAYGVGMSTLRDTVADPSTNVDSSVSTTTCIDGDASIRVRHNL